MVELCDKISIVHAEEVAAKDAKTYVDHIYDQVCEALHAAVEYCRPTGKRSCNSNQNKKWWWNKDCLNHAQVINTV